MLPRSCILVLLLLCMFSSLYHVTVGTFNLTLPHQHPEPQVVVKELQRRVQTSISRRKLLPITQPLSSCLSGNPIDDCWRCDPNWNINRQHLAECSLGFGRDAAGGKGGQYYIVTSPNDNADTPQPGTLRHAVSLPQPLWIVFASNMVIKLKQALHVTSFKTIDGRGVKVVITGGGCLVIDNVSNVIVHNVVITGCVPNGSDGDGISVIASAHVWIDHCAMSKCTDGLIDVTKGSTAVTISNCYFRDHDKVMLLGHSDDFVADQGMQVTVAFNHFGENLVQRMPRCRRGYFHVVNNDYTRWEMYAIGGSASPTINSQGNRYIAPDDGNSKEVTKREYADENEWVNWEWRTDRDLLMNGAFFVPSGPVLAREFADDSTGGPQPAQLIDQLTMNAGVFGQTRGNGGSRSAGSGGGDDNKHDDDGFFGMSFTAGAPPSRLIYSYYFQIIFILYTTITILIYY